MKQVNGRHSERVISGFSKLSKKKKIEWLVEHFFQQPEEVKRELESYWREQADQQKVIDGFSENTITNFILPYSVAPNFVINGRTYCVPMVIEESSVVAAASAAAKFWLSRGGFQAEVLSTTKVGQVHFYYYGNEEALKNAFVSIKAALLGAADDITTNMRRRGGGVQDIELLDFTGQEPHYFQLKATFETCDSMGANFINSVLERYAHCLPGILKGHIPGFQPQQVEVVMAILSNFTPECLVRASVECPVEDMDFGGSTACGISAVDFAERFRKAVRIAHIDPYRATTHNKGIFNGVDAVVLATANDFRAIEACGHTYAARDGQYRSLTHCTIEEGVFRFWLDLPLAVGTVGGLTKLHPMAKRSLELLGNPSAEELMMVIAATGLAQNFAAVRSLVTTGIQRGHMKMHLTNILNHLGADESTAEAVRCHFSDKVVSFNAVRTYLQTLEKQRSV